MGIGIVLVEICDRNSIMKANLAEIEEKYPEAAVLETNCVDMCSLCRARPFALVNGKRVYAKTTEACMAEIEKLIQQELIEFYGE